VTVYGRRSAYNVQKVCALGELGPPYEHVEAGGAAGGLDVGRLAF
jgi:glutathione S-transferase